MKNPELREVRLHGAVGAAVGEEWWLRCRTPTEAIRLIDANTGGGLTRRLNNNILYSFVVGERSIPIEVRDDSGRLAASGLEFPYPMPDPFHLYPDVHGAGGGGESFGDKSVGKKIISIASFGVLSLVGGLFESQSPEVPDNASHERPEDLPSFFITAPKNLREQGGPIPLCYGHIRAGCITVSAGSYSDTVIPEDVPQDVRTLISTNQINATLGSDGLSPAETGSLTIYSLG